MAVAFDAVGPSSSGTGSATSPLTWTHVNGGNGILVGVTIFNGSTNTVTAVTYGGVTVPLLGFTQSGSGGAGGVALYGLVGGTCPTGSNTVSVSFSDGANHNAGSISVSGAGSLGTPVTNTSTTGSVTANVAGTTAGGLIVLAACYGGTSLATFSGTNGVTIQWQHPGGPSTGADNGCGGTVASAGGTQTVGVTDTGTDFWGIVAVEVTASGGGASAAPPQLAQRGGKTYRRRYERRQAPVLPSPPAPVTISGTAAITGTGTLLASTGTPYLAGIAGTGASYFTDNHGQPRMWLGDEIWALLTNAGRWNSGNYQATFDSYFATRAAQGFTVCYSDMFGSTFIGGAANGQMWNGQTPFTSNNPSSGLNSTYWQVIDYALASAQANGITLALSFGGHWDWDVSGNAMFGFTGTQYQDAGNAIGTRYKNQANLIWLIMDDYFGSFDSSLSSLLTGLRASGDTHPIAIENYAETSSRFDLSTNGSLSWGASNTQWNFGYSYSCSYLCVEYMFGEASPLTPLYGDGYFYQGGSTYQGGSGAGALDRAIRQDAWWAVTSGARGWNIGDEALWQWASTAPASVSTQWFAANNAGNIRAFMESLPGWQTLAPDTSSVLVTAGRGTRGSQLSSGGGGGQYEPATTNSFVSASRTPDTGSGSSLAVAYLPAHTTITIDQTKMVAGYVAFWVDPITGAKTSTTAGSTYNSTAQGSNSQGDPDWVLLLQAGTTVSGTASITGQGSLTAAVTQAAAAAVTGAGTVTGLAVQGSGGTITGAGTAVVTATQGVTAAMAGAGTVSALVTEQATAAVTAAGTMAAAVTQQATAPITGTGTVAASSAGSATGTAAITGSGSVTALAVQGATAAITSAGTLTSAITQQATATLAGGGTVTATATESATAAITAAGSLTAAAAQQATAAITGTGTLAALPGGTGAGNAAITGSGTLTVTVVQQATAQITGTGTVTPAAVQRAPAAITGAGTVTATGAVAGTTTITGTGSLTAKTTQAATATLTGTGAVTAAVVLGSTAAITGAGTVAATGALIVPAVFATATATGGTLATATPGGGTVATATAGGKP